MKRLPLALALSTVLLAGCATQAPDAEPPAAPALQWRASLPHDGDPQGLVGWWQRFDDPLLPALIDAAQAGSPSLAQAQARVAQARAASSVAGAARGPSLNGTAQGTRSRSVSAGNVPLTQAGAGFEAQWELDLFGGLGHNAAAAQARAHQAQLGWHDARVSVAAEVALAYVSLRSCEALVAVYEQEARSQRKSAELTREKVRVGFDMPANAALADASAAQSRERQTAQQAECDVGVKALVLLTTLPEPGLRERLLARRGVLPRAAGFALAALPAQVLAQRPDVAAAEYDLMAAAADVGFADAQRYPRLSFSGNVGYGLLRGPGLGGVSTADGLAWGFGPALVLPLFDGGRNAAQRASARARFDEARAGVDLRLRTAVREVEEALVRIDATRRRERDASIAAQGFRDYFDSAETRWRLGAGSLFEMEEARRSALQAQAGLVGVQGEQVAAWVSLYRAAGGGWDGQRAGSGATVSR